MDLDKLKNTWKNAEIKPTINEEQIQQILNNKGKSAFSKLIKYEKAGLVILLILATLGIVILTLTTINSSIKDDYFPKFYFVSCLLASLWQAYKYKYLSKVDPLKMNVLQISQNINTYKKYIVRELVVSIVWVIVMFLVFFTNKLPNITLLHFIFLIMSASVSLIALTFIIYKFTVSKYLTNIEESIKEVEEFKKDNKE